MSGPLPSGWQTRRLGDLAVEGPTNGYSGPTAPDAGGTPTLRLSATTSGSLILNASTTKRLAETVPSESDLWLKPGDLLVQRSNTPDLVGTAAVYDGPPASYVYPDLMMRLRLADPATTAWVCRYMNSPAGRRFFSSMAAGSSGSMPKISGAKLREMPVALPPLPEQRRIAAILDEADALRRKRRDALALFDDLLRATFLDMFGDPVTNPKRWPMVAIREIVASIEAGWSSPSLDHAAGPGDWGVLKVSAVSTGRFLEEENKAVEGPDFQKPPVVPRRGDMLFSRANTRELVAATCLVEHDAPRRFLPDKLWRVACHPDVALVEWLRFLLGHEDFRASLAKHATGTSGSMLNVSQEKFLSMLTPLPPVDRQRAFGQVVWEVLAERERSVLAVADAEALFSSLLHRAFAGRL